MGFGCWKNGCGVRCGDERKTTRRACDARRSMTAGAVAGGAVQTRKTAADTLQPGVERFGHGEIARDDLDGRRQPRRIRSPRERAHRHARGQQLVDHRTPDPAGGSRHEDGMQAWWCHEHSIAHTLLTQDFS